MSGLSLDFVSAQFLVLVLNFKIVGLGLVLVWSWFGLVFSLSLFDPPVSLVFFQVLSWSWSIFGYSYDLGPGLSPFLDHGLSLGLIMVCVSVFVLKKS